MKRILVIASAKGFFTFEYLRNVVDFEKYHVDIANVDSVDSVIPSQYELFYKRNNINVLNYTIDLSPRFHKFKMLVNRSRNIRKLNIVKKYDIVHILYVSEEAVGVMLRRKHIKTICTVFGSDVLRAKKIKKPIIKYIFNKCDRITVATQYMNDFVLKTYGTKLQSKMYRVDFGNSNIEYVKGVLSENNGKENCRLFGLPEDKILVFVGYNGSPAHKHIETIKELEKMSDINRDRIHVVLHCAYALNDNYKQKLLQYANDSPISISLITDYLTGVDLIKFRSCCDIMTNLQPTDALSSSMLEYLALGSIVIKGNWLHYSELTSSNSFVISISDYDSLSATIDDIVERLPEYKKLTKCNYETAYKLCSWNYQGTKWKELIDELL